MKFLDTRKTALAAGLLYGLCAGVPLHADDTEIYVGLANTQNAAEPNVLFIIDTSGSMNTAVEVFNPSSEYDPLTDYSSYASCTSDKIYWSDDGSIPGCGTDNWFYLSQLRCDNAVVPLDTLKAGVGVGFYQDRVARFRSHSNPNRNRWRLLIDNVNNPPHVECKADDGVHGENAADTRLYIRNGSSTNPWTATQSQGLNWDNTGDFYTLYSANYMNWANGSSGPTSYWTTRLEIVKDVVQDLIDANQGLRIGLMRFDDGCDNFGGPVISEMKDIDNAGVKTDLKNIIEALTYDGCTPLAETMYEALLYYRGQDVHFGDTPNLASVNGAMVPGWKKYDSPIEYECQKNFIVMLTDGDPVQDDDGETEINALLNTASGLTLGNCNFSSGDDCLDELAEFGYNVDNATLALGNDIQNEQNIITYTVGFATNQTLLSSAANNGGGKYYTADDPTELSTAFTKIITEIQAVNTTFTAPAVSVNAFNRVTHRKELYFTLFKPQSTPHWPGNVKRFELDYELDGAGNPVDSDGDGIPDPPKILDVNGDPAVDANTGFFSAAATSYWTDTADAPDGDETRKGGAAKELPELPTNRKVYTNVGSVVDLTDASNALHESNTLITDAMLKLTGGPGEPTRNTLLQWARGVDTEDDDDDGSTTDGRKEMGDPLHAKPLLVTYGGTEANPDITMFAITNDGYLHAFDVDDGTEVFSFVPKELLGNLKIIHENVGGSTHNYGLDGGIEVWITDHNDNAVIETPDSDGNMDHVYLYFGQRRGGTNYYALDVTNRAAPKMLWHIQGAVAGDFLELADTWSTPVYHQIKVKSGSTLVAQDVIVFGGGYDAEQDNNTTRLADDEGRAVYMVDAATGALLWWAGKSGLTGPAPDLALTGMDYSIPSEVRVLDVNTDGFADRLYVGDMGGQMWRFDIDNATVDVLANRITGGVIADVQKLNATHTPTAADNRRFYYPPDVALNLVPDGPDFLSLAVGTGYRAHPLNLAIEDRFYMIKDFDIYDPPKSGSPPAITYTAITEADLDDRTLTGVTSTNPYGWYIKLNNISSGAYEGEKVLAEALTFDGTVLFTTFTPVASGSQSACSPSQGLARLYQVSLYDASPLENMDGLGDDSNLTRSDRSLVLVRTGIPPEVTILFPGLAQAKPVALVGAEQVELTLSQTPVRTYWFQEQN